MTADRLAQCNKASRAVDKAAYQLKYFTESDNASPFSPFFDLGLSESCRAEVVALITRDLEAKLSRLSQELYLL